MNSFIENLNQWGGDFLSFAWPMLWQSSLLIIVLLAIDFLVRGKIRASIRYALWLVVLVKLCLPPALALPTGAAWWLFPGRTAVRPPAIPRYTVSYDTASSLMDSVPETIPAPVLPSPEVDGAGWVLLGCGLMSAGLLLWLALRWWQISRKVSGAMASEEFTSLLDEARRRAGLRSAPQLRLVSGRMSPAVCGLYCPVILLPRVLAERLSAAQLRAVLLHEAFHLRRKDVWVNCAQALLQIVYWWHPLLWLANARIRRLREEAVDDAVMLALRGEAENYAPTLLAVAKLALSRPLMSLGLVGIMESRTALRKRIERLVNFRPVRKAGLTFLSLGGIFVFGAVALPMGEAPAPAERPDSTEIPAVEQQSLTLKVDPDIFVKNVEAQAAASLLTSTNDYTAILLELLRTEGVDCTPPHGIAFNTRTGEITTQNTPDQLEIFRQVIGQLNRPDGHCALPLWDNPLRKRRVLIEARIYQMPAGDFDGFVSGLHFYHGQPDGDDWWSASPEQFSQLVDRLETSGLRLIQRPRIETGSGITGEFFIGNGTNNVEFDCKPYVADGFVDLAVRGTIVDIAPARAAFTNYYSARASAENRGGIVVRLKNYGGDADNNLVAVIGVEMVTNTIHFQQRLQRILSPHSSTVTEPAASGQVQTVSGAGGAERPPGFSERLQMTASDKAASANGLVRDAKLLYEMGKFKEAETRLESALTLEPDNQAAHYYMNLVQEAKASHRTGMIQISPGRRNILDNLSRLQFDQFGPYDRRPLSEVVRELNQLTTGLAADQSGIHFFIADSSNGRQPVIDQNTGLPAEGSGSKGVDLDSVTVSFSRALTNLTLANVLDVIVMAANRPLKYSISDKGIVFSAGDNPEAPQLYSRVFKLNHPVSGHELRGALLAAGVTNPPTSYFYTDSGMIMVRGSEAQLARVNRVVLKLNGFSTKEMVEGDAASIHYPSEAAATAENPTNLFSRTFKVAASVFANAARNVPGLDTNNISAIARSLFGKLGVAWESPKGKAVFYNDRLGLLFVRATLSDLDIVEHAVQALIYVAPQIHIKARFFAVPKGTLDGFGKIMNGTNQLDGLAGILTSDNAKVALNSLEPRPGVEELAEPEVTTTSGRQTQVRATRTITVITNFTFEETSTNTAVFPQTTRIEAGPILDVVPTVSGDGYTIDLTTIASVTEFLGYDKNTNTAEAYTSKGQKLELPTIMPAFAVRKASTNIRLLDNQTAVLGALKARFYVGGKEVGAEPGYFVKTKAARGQPDEQDKELLVFITATLIDPAGNRIHSDDEMPFAKNSIPPQDGP